MKVMNGPHKYEFTQFEKNFMKANFNALTNRQVADMLGFKLTIVRTWCYANGLKRMELEYWTDEQVKYLKSHYKKIGDVELAEIFEKKWPKNKHWTKKHIEKKRKYLNLIRTQEQVLSIEKRNIKKGRFKICNFKRWLATGKTPIGELRMWKNQNGNYFMVIKLKSGFVHFAPWLYKQLYGSIPKGHIVTLKDGNHENVTPANLELLTRAENARRNTSKSSKTLSDNYIIGLLCQGGKRHLKNEIAQNKDLIELKRLQLTLNRTINESANRKEAAEHA